MCVCIVLLLAILGSVQPPHFLQALPSFGPQDLPLLLWKYRHELLCRIPLLLVIQCVADESARLPRRRGHIRELVRRQTPIGRKSVWLVAASR